jgi:hypothetical protein
MTRLPHAHKVTPRRTIVAYAVAHAIVLFVTVLAALVLFAALGEGLGLIALAGLLWVGAIWAAYDAGWPVK